MRLIKQLEDAPGDVQDKCHALWALITTGKDDDGVALLSASAAQSA
ncbi:hypothetical protein [Nitrosospira multiformis]|nr:hypothetical protein [Nitrosospira multiformis]